MASIYVIDDNENTCKIIKKILQSEGYMVRTECNPLEAVRFLSELDDAFPSVIFLDLVMPQMTGYEFLEKIKRKPELENIPIVLLTSKEELEHMVKSYELGADYFMSKPTTKKQLLFALKTVLKDVDTKV